MLNDVQIIMNILTNVVDHAMTVYIAFSACSSDYFNYSFLCILILLAKNGMIVLLFPVLSDTYYTENISYEMSDIC